MNPTHSNPSPAPIQVACIASGLGHVRRGLEIWMAQLARQLQGYPSVAAEAWGGPTLEGCALPIRRFWMLRRDSSFSKRFRWHRRYHLEQLTAVLPMVWALRRHQIQIAFCADPSLAWNLKRLRAWHGARVLFSDGIRLSPRWLQSYDGIHLLTPIYLEEARAAVDPHRLERFFAIPYFVDSGLFHPASRDTRAQCRRTLGIPADHRVAICLGPVGTESSKRLDHVAAELAATGDDRWTLLSVGADEPGASSVRARCEASLGARIRFCGSQPREKLPALFHASDIYTLGALAEPFSIAILEALACGLPVLHHRFPVTEWITGEAGIAVDMTKSGAAAEALKAFAHTPDEARPWRDAAIRLAGTRYSPDTVATQLIEQFKLALRRPSP